MDLYQREGKYKVPEAGGKILGVEFSGTIEKLGENTEDSGFKVGDEVFGLAYGSMLQLILRHQRGILFFVHVMKLNIMK